MTSWGPTTPTVTRPSTRPWPAWCRTSPCATPSSTATAASAGAAPTTARRPCATPSAGWPRSPSSSWPTSTRTRSTRIANYDGSDEEPIVLPGRFPNLLINGAQGIAVGMATNIPPHNMGEVIDAAIHVLHNPEATPDDLMAVRQGPGLPDRRADPRAARASSTPTGPAGAPSRCAPWPRSKRAASATASWSPSSRTRPRSRSLSRRSPTWCRSGDLDGISELRNASANQQPRLVIELKRDANANVVLNNLFKQTPLQTSFGVNMLALVDCGAPHPEPGPGPRRTTSTTRSRWSPGASEFRLRKAQRPGPHRRGPAQGHRHARRGDRHHPRLGRPPVGPRRARWPRPSRSPRTRPPTSST